MAKKGSITIKELHVQTGEYVRRAGRGRSPLPVTDRGKVVAALVPPNFSQHCGAGEVCCPGTPRGSRVDRRPTSCMISMPCAGTADNAVL
jgi:hypothetical protein